MYVYTHIYTHIHIDLIYIYIYTHIYTYPSGRAPSTVTDIDHATAILAHTCVCVWLSRNACSTSSATITCSTRPDSIATLCVNLVSCLPCVGMRRSFIRALAVVCHLVFIM